MKELQSFSKSPTLCYSLSDVPCSRPRSQSIHCLMPLLYEKHAPIQIQNNDWTKIDMQLCSVATVTHWQREHRPHKEAIPTNSCHRPGCRTRAAQRASKPNGAVWWETAESQGPDWTPVSIRGWCSSCRCISHFSFIQKESEFASCRTDWQCAPRHTNPANSKVHFRGTFLIQTKT